MKIFLYFQIFISRYFFLGGRADFAATVSPHRGLRRGLVGFSFFDCCGMLDKAGVTGSEHILACLSFFAPAGS